MKKIAASFALLCALVTLVLPVQAAPDGNLCGRKERSACYGYCSVAHPNGAGMKDCVAACLQDGVPCGADGSPVRMQSAPGAAADAKMKACVRGAFRDCSLHCSGQGRAECNEGCRAKAEAHCNAPS